jgi:hypothetical protein
MADYKADYPTLQPTNGSITIAQLALMNTNEVNKGTTANNAYASGFVSESDFSYYKGGTLGVSGIANYMSKTFGKNSLG